MRIVLLATIGLLIPLAIGGTRLTNAYNPRSASAGTIAHTQTLTELDAWSECQLLVDLQLNASEVSEYPALSEVDWQKHGSNVWQFSSHVDSETDSGAVVRQPFECRLRLVANTAWILEELSVK